MEEKVLVGKNRSMGPELIWPNITIGFNGILDILALRRVRHRVNVKRVLAWTKM